MKRCLLSQQALSLDAVTCVCVCVCVCVRVGYSCVINQWHLECDCMQWGVFVPVFHTVMQAAHAGSTFLQNIGTTGTWCHTPADHNVNTWCCESIRSQRAQG